MTKADLQDALSGLVDHLRYRGLVTNWLKSKIRLRRSQRANANNKKSPRSFCHVIIGEFNIHYADALLDLPLEFVVGILLHEIAHMIIEEDGGDPELGVDEWVLENVPEAGYSYRDAKYGRRVAKNLECVSLLFVGEVLD